MARREKVVTITAEGRDKGKRFNLREMPADKAERWAIRCLLAFANAGARLPEEQIMSGLAGMDASIELLLIQGIRSLAGLRYHDAEPLLAEILECVEYMPPGSEGARMNLNGSAGMTQIEEVRT